ncbi:IPTL-CTERM sorting domain-containing protein [Pseudomonas sp.]
MPTHSYLWWPASVGGAAAIPTLSAWGAILMTALLAMLGLRHASAALIQP